VHKLGRSSNGSNYSVNFRRSKVLSTVLGGAASGGMVGSVASSGIGGVALMAIIGFIKKSMAK
jgi:hypothetical protein